MKSEYGFSNFSENLKKFFDLIGQYEFLIDNINTQVWYLKDPCTYGMVNQAHANFLGKSKEDLINKSIKGVLTQNCVEYNKYVFNKKQGFTIQEPYLNHKGDRRILKIQRVPQFDENGDVSYVMCTGEDVTNVVETEYSVGFLSKLIEKSRDGIIVTDLAYKITYMNDSAEKLFGYSFKELKGKTPDLLNGEDNADEIQKIIRSSIKNGEEYTGEHLNKRKDGSKFVCSYRVMPVFEEDQIINYVGYHRDITEKMRYKKEFENMCRMFEDIYRESPMSIIIHDKDTGEIVDANKRAIESYGFDSVEELRENKFWYDSPYSFKEALGLIKKTRDEGPVQVKWLNKDKDGNKFWEIVNLELINIDNVDRVMAICINIKE